MLRANPKKGRKSKSLRVDAPLESVIGEMKQAGGSDSLKPVSIAQAAPPAHRKTSADHTPQKSHSGGLTPPKGHKRSTSTGHRLRAAASTRDHSQTVGTTVVRSTPHFASPGIDDSVLHSSSNIPIPQPRPVSEEQLQQLYLQMYFHFHLSK